MKLIRILLAIFINCSLNAQTVVTFKDKKGEGTTEATILSSDVNEARNINISGGGFLYSTISGMTSLRYQNLKPKQYLANIELGVGSVRAVGTYFFTRKIKKQQCICI